MAWARPGHPYGTVTRVHDGDTPIMDLDLGLDTWRKSIGVRLTIDTKHWINAIELANPGGVEARDNLASILTVGSVWPHDDLGFVVDPIRVGPVAVRVPVELDAGHPGRVERDR
jgi:hypothetical protein